MKEEEEDKKEEENKEKEKKKMVYIKTSAYFIHNSKSVNLVIYFLRVK